MARTTTAESVTRDLAGFRCMSAKFGGAAAVLAAGALTVAVLAGCGSTADTRSPPSGPELGGALRTWSRFPVNASPRPLVVVGPEVSDPPAGFPGGAIKLAYLRRAVRFAARLPPGPATAGGFQLISARQAVALFRSGAATGPPAGIRLTVTTVRLGAGVFVTDRGLRRLPTWQFGFAGVRGLAAVLAVAPAQVFSPPTPAGGRPPFVDWAFLGPGGRVLTVRFTRLPDRAGAGRPARSVLSANAQTFLGRDR
jgi:hypothetical protein